MRTGLLSRVNEGGLSMVVATVDERGMPACCRAVGARAEAGGEAVTVWVPVATSRAIVENLATNPRIALVLSEPISHETIQVKGVSRSVRLALAGDRDVVVEQMEKLSAVLDRLGMPRRVTTRINRWPAFAIELSVEEVYDQTPGPKAGRLMR